MFWLSFQYHNIKKFKLSTKHFLKAATWSGVSLDTMRLFRDVPLIELPPLSPGIQARVMEEVEVVDTVKRGWSGGTGGEDRRSD